MPVSKLTAVGHFSFLFTLLIVLTIGTPLPGQLHGVQAPLKKQPAGISGLNSTIGQPAAKPFKVTSRFHLLEGTTSGYLVLQVDLEDGNFIYSLEQDGAISPTTIQVAESDHFFIDGKFNPDRPAEIIENDPVFNQRLEKHKGKVQFFVPVKFDAQSSIGQVQPELVLNGQVCSDSGVCMQIRNKHIKAEFGGYFGRTVEIPKSPTAPLVR